MNGELEPPKSPSENEVPDDKPQVRPNVGSSIFWLMVGLAPIPICLISFATPNPKWGAIKVLLILCSVCNLLGGIGCLGRIKNVGVRVILGIALAAVFFVLTAIVAVFQACAHSRVT